MKLIQRTALFILFSTSVLAQDIKIVGSVDQPIELPNSARAFKATPASAKHISLLKIELSDAARKKINSRADEVLESNEMPQDSAAKKIQLGMGNVPVLDQGNHGTCVTFANTAAVDAVLNKGDYISQLCQLQLGRYLERNAYTVSGWDGSFGGAVLNQMVIFGLVSKAQQLANGCGQLTQYPSNGNDAELGSEMSPIEYRAISEPMNEDVVAWSSILDAYGAFIDKTDMNKTMSQVKAALDAHDRLTFGVFLPDVGKGVAGAVGKHHANFDSWVLTPEIVDAMKSEADIPGHELIITGYDDDAVAFDNHGRIHRGLFTLRNSWGPNIGDKGDFYMSYDYFKALTIEVQRIRGMAN